MSSTSASGPQLKAKRSFVPWSSHCSGSQVRAAQQQKKKQSAGSSASQSPVTQTAVPLPPMPPMPARVVSDIPETPSTMAGPHAGPRDGTGEPPAKRMAMNSHILQAQQRWEKKNEPGSASKSPIVIDDGFPPLRPGVLTKNPPAAAESSKREDSNNPLTQSPYANKFSTLDMESRVQEARDAGAVRLVTNGATAERRYPAARASSSSESSRTTPDLLHWPSVGFLTPDGLVSVMSRKQYHALVSLGATHTICTLPRETSNWKAGEADRVEYDKWTMPSGFTQKFFSGDDAILTRPDGRPYNELTDSDGTTKVHTGCVFPTSFQPHIDQNTRYVCPVRTCRKAMQSITRLTGHMRASHCKTALNDNLDGTFSLVGEYLSEVGRSPGIVVTRNRTAADARPGAAPANSAQPPPGGVKGSEILKRRADKLEGASATADTTRLAGSSAPSSTAPSRATETPRETGQSGQSDTENETPETHLNKFLSPNQKKYPARIDITAMQKLEKRRNLPHGWIMAHEAGTLDANMYASGLAYITGELKTGRNACKQNAGASARLSSICVSLPDTLTLAERLSFARQNTCVGCRYISLVQHSVNQCDWKTMGLPDTVPIPSKEGRARASPLSVESPSESRSRWEKTAMAAADETKSKQLNVAAGQETRSTRSTPTGGSLANNADDDVEMEDWEVAPGRITDGPLGDNIGFSGPFLYSADPVPVADSTGCNIITIKPGGRQRWPPEADKMRVCFVGAGKIKVTMNQTTAQYGTDSAVVVPPGQWCLMENRMYVEAKLYCMTQSEYRLRPQLAGGGLDITR